MPKLTVKLRLVVRISWTALAVAVAGQAAAGCSADDVPGDAGMDGHASARHGHADHRTFDTSALAAAFPFASPDLRPRLGETPVLIGLNAYSSGVVLWDRFAHDNYNSVTIARSGAGKSYFTKLEVLRLLFHQVEVCVVDPEDEYRRLSDAVGGTVLGLGTPGVCLNPFDLPAGLLIEDGVQDDSASLRGSGGHPRGPVLGNEAILMAVDRNGSTNERSLSR